MSCSRGRQSSTIPDILCLSLELTVRHCLLGLKLPRVCLLLAPVTCQGLVACRVRLLGATLCWKWPTWPRGSEGTELRQGLASCVGLWVPDRTRGIIFLASVWMGSLVEQGVDAHIGSWSADFVGNHMGLVELRCVDDFGLGSIFLAHFPGATLFISANFG